MNGAGTISRPFNKSNGIESCVERLSSTSLRWKDSCNCERRRRIRACSGCKLREIHSLYLLMETRRRTKWPKWVAHRWIEQWIRRNPKESEEIRMDQRIEVNREKKYIFNCRIYKRQKKKHFPVAQFDCVLLRFVCRFAFFRWHC